jgi:tRNA (guanine37-N1)-methyltransferase
MIVAGRYEGIDARAEEYYADLIVSVGDFVVMGGDLPAMLMLEGMLRLTPGVVGKQESVECESFKGPFVDYPSYSLPVIWKGKEIPEVLRSGNHAAIVQWREQQAIKKTVLSHFEWLRSYPLKHDDKQKVLQIIPNHYIALLHSDVMLPNGQIGTTSVTSMDIHDIARSSKTFAIRNYFIVTPLVDQQSVVQTLLDFWQTGIGIDYNAQRHEAVSLVRLKADLEEVIQTIEQQEGQKPVLISSSARSLAHQQIITFYDQEMVWERQRPVLFILGTGKGLSDNVINRCDFLLEPIQGFTAFNHLSVRSAAAIILDRWLGLNHKQK